MRTKRALATTRLNFEPLEDRLLLAAAVGSFTRPIPFDVNDPNTIGSGAGVSVLVAGDLSFAQDHDDGDQILAKSFAAVSKQVEGSSAYARNENTVYVPTPPNGTTAVPAVSMCTESEVSVSGGSALAQTEYGGGVSIGRSSATKFVYDAPAGMNLVLQGHLFVSANAEVAVSEFGGVSFPSSPNIRVEIEGTNALWADLEYNEVEGLYWTWDFGLAFNGFHESGTTLGSANPGELRLHKVFELPYFESYDGSPVNFDATTSLEISATTGFGPASASAIVTADTAAWGFALPAGQALTPGDFNADGAVDMLDFELLCSGMADICEQNPKADANLDGKVDVLDYNIWADNADAIIVTLTTDEFDGNYAPNDISLREAIALAADVNHPGHDIIAFADNVVAAGVVNVTAGTLVISGTNEVSILGPGADNLTIHRNGGATLFQVNGGGAVIESTIACLKLTGTSPTGIAVRHADFLDKHHLVLDHVHIVDNGVGVSSGTSQLMIVDSLIAGNKVYGVLAGSSGYIPTAKLSVIDSTIKDNYREGINAYYISTLISGSEISGNNAVGSLNRPGVLFAVDEYQPGLTLTIVNSTIAETKNNGAGISLQTDTTTNIVNSTISSNTGVGLISWGTATLTNVTITQNKAQPSQTNGVAAGGIYVGGGTATLFNTIVADNFHGAVRADLGKHPTNPLALFSGASSHNLISAVGNSGVTSTPTNKNIILGATESVGLTALGDHGGRTRTHALLLASRAIDAGNDAAFDELLYGEYDQRGFGFDRIVDKETNPADNGPGDIDIGAFELAMNELYG